MSNKSGIVLIRPNRRSDRPICFGKFAATFIEDHAIMCSMKFVNNILQILSDNNNSEKNQALPCIVNDGKADNNQLEGMDLKETVK